MSPYSRERLLIAAYALAVVCFLQSSLCHAANTGVLLLQWDANITDADLDSYRVFITTNASVYSLTPAEAQLQATTRLVAAGTTETTFTSLDTNQTYHLAVTCVDVSGNESIFSNVVSAQPFVTPIISTIAPTFGTQGDSGIALTVNGSNFQSGATVSFGPGVAVLSLNTSGVPSRLIATVDVDAVAEVDMRDVVVTNPGNATVTKLNGFQVRLDVDRVDINQSSRIDGGDLIEVAAGFAARVGDAAYSVTRDLNVDGIVDGVDLSLLLSYFGSVGPF